VTDGASTAPRSDELRSELESHHGQCFAWALSCVGGERAEAQDVVQAAYLKVLDGRARFGGRSSFRTWIFGVIRLTAAEQRRRRWRQLAAWQGPGAAEAEIGVPTPRESEADAKRLRRALALLPARQREVLHLVFYEDLSIREASEVMGVSLGSARTHYERGKRRLRRLLGIGEDA